MDKKLQAWLEDQKLNEGLPAPGPIAGPEEALPPELDPVAAPPGMPEPVPEAPMEPDVGEMEPKEPGEELELLDFDDFREDYIDRSVNEKPDDLLDRLDDLRGIVDLGPREKKFVSDNIQILLLMKEQDVYEASRKLHHLEEPLDLVSQLSELLNKSEPLRDVVVKLPSFFGMKSDLYRKFIAALIGGVQVGGGGTVEDLVLSPTKGQRVLFSTRFYTAFGSVQLVPWGLSSGDPELFLKDIERERLERGSPEEKKVLLKRVLLASISKLVGGRIFLITVMSRSSGKRTEIAIRLDQFLNEGYEKGSLEIQISEDEDRMVITSSGEPMAPGKLTVLFMDPEEGSEPVPFFEVRDGVLYLVADSSTIEDAINKIGSGFYGSSESEETPEELETVQRCVPTLQEMLLKRC